MHEVKNVPLLFRGSARSCSRHRPWLAARANEARYFKNKYDHVVTVEPAGKTKKTVDRVHRILNAERDIVISSPPFEATPFQFEQIRIAAVIYESGLSINATYPIDNPNKRAVGFKLYGGIDVLRSSPLGSSSRGRSRSRPEPSAAPTSSSKAVPIRLHRCTGVPWA